MLNIRNTYVKDIVPLPEHLAFRNQLFLKQNSTNEYNRSRRKEELYDVSVTKIFCSVKK